MPFRAHLLGLHYSPMRCDHSDSMRCDHYFRLRLIAIVASSCMFRYSYASMLRCDHSDLMFYCSLHFIVSMRLIVTEYFRLRLMHLRKTRCDNRNRNFQYGAPMFCFFPMRWPTLISELKHVWIIVYKPIGSGTSLQSQSLVNMFCCRLFSNAIDEGPTMWYFVCDRTFGSLDLALNNIIHMLCIIPLVPCPQKRYI